MTFGRKLDTIRFKFVKKRYRFLFQLIMLTQKNIIRILVFYSKARISHPVMVLSSQGMTDRKFCAARILRTQCLKSIYKNRKRVKLVMLKYMLFELNQL